MPDKSQAAWPFSSSELLQQVNPGPLMDVQRRNLEAVTKSALKIADTMTTIASKELAAFSALGSAVPKTAPTGNGNFADFMSAQIHASRDAIEKSIREMRAVSDAARQCWYEVAGEFEACARDNIGYIEKQFKQSAAASPLRSVAPVQRSKTASE